jgi:demethylmenaquinone methyltransferase/2-methoxy-6-polyprenyl-1,4-benzoquinol methylase
MQPNDRVRKEIQALEESNPLRESTLQSAIAALNLAPGTHGLDIGCGIGLQALLLTQATQPGGQVTGVDISPGLLAYARQKILASAFADRIFFKEGSMTRLPFEDNTFDWAWSADCVGYPAGDHLPVLREIARVVRPGGKVAILAWTSQQVLPGYALLEARLNATCSAYAPFLQGKAPEAHFLRAARWFSEVGILNAACHTFVGEVLAPLRPEIRTALASLFDMLWGESPGDATETDRLAFKSLCEPQSPDFILDVPDYYAFFTYTMFTGMIEKSE